MKPMVGEYRPRPVDLFQQAMEYGWVRMVPDGRAYRAWFTWNEMEFVGIGPTPALALKGLEGHVRESKAGVIRA